MKKQSDAEIVAEYVLMELDRLVMGTVTKQDVAHYVQHMVEAVKVGLFHSYHIKGDVDQLRHGGPKG